MKTSSGRGDANGSIPDGEPNGPDRDGAPEEAPGLVPDETTDAAPDAVNGSAGRSSISVRCMD